MNRGAARSRAPAAPGKFNFYSPGKKARYSSKLQTLPAVRLAPAKFDFAAMPKVRPHPTLNTLTRKTVNSPAAVDTLGIFMK